MTKHLCTLIALILSISAYSQVVIEKPRCGLNTAQGLSITKIERTDTATIVSFSYKRAVGQVFSIPKQTYIQAVGTSEKLFVKKAEGIDLDIWVAVPTSGQKVYKLFFPALDKTALKFDYVEANDGGNWAIYNIQCKALPSKNSLPEEMLGNWYNASTGNWELSLADTMAVYQNKVWTYTLKELKNGQGAISLKNGQLTSTLYFKKDKNGIYSFGSQVKQLAPFGKERKSQKVAAGNPFFLPLLKNDTAVFSGWVKGYTPRSNMKSINVGVTDIIIQNATNNWCMIDEAGYFTLKIPIYHPILAWYRLGSLHGSVFLEPGKDVFLMIDPTAKDNGSFFMGGSGQLNTELSVLDIGSYDNMDRLNQTYPNLSPAEFKTLCLDMQDKENKKLDSLLKQEAISAKAYQIKKGDIKYVYARELLMYKMNFEYEYRKKNNIPRNQRELPVKLEGLDRNFYDFANDQMVNDPYAVLAPNYFGYLNWFCHIDLLHLTNSFYYILPKMVADLEKAGFALTAQEKSIPEIDHKRDSLSSLPEQKRFNEKYGAQRSAFFDKYMTQLQPFYNKGGNTGYENIEKFLTDAGVKFTEDEIQLLKILKENDQTETSQQITKLRKMYNESFDQFRQKYQLFFDRQRQERAKTELAEQLETTLSIKKGFGTDVLLLGQDFKNMYQNMEVATDSEMKAMQAMITTPFVADYIVQVNEKIKQKKDDILNQGKFVTVVEIKGGKEKDILELIKEKHKGELIVVDLWATWCGPCRSGIASMKQMKEEMVGKKISFVYITDQTSPEKEWNKVIKDIKGEHYRIENNEFADLKNRFNAMGIPHMILIGKTGEIISPNFGLTDVYTMQKTLEKYIK